MRLCLDWARARPIPALAIMIVCGLASTVSAHLVWSYENQRAPASPAMIGEPIVQVLPGGARRLLVHYALADAGECTRQGFYTLLRIEGEARPVHTPLGGFLNGDDVPILAPDYRVEFFLPAEIRPGKVLFQLRIHYVCPIATRFHLFRPPLKLVSFDWIAPVHEVHLP